jgi:hypothetical protein
MVSNITADGLDAVLDEVVDSIEGPVFLIAPPAELIGSLAHLDREPGEYPELSLLATDDVLREARSDFLTATATADLIEAGTLDLRAFGDDRHTRNTKFVGQNAVFAVVMTGDNVTALTTDDDDLVADGLETAAERWDDGEAFDLRTPGRSRLLDTMATELGDTTREDFETYLRTAPAVRGQRAGNDGVHLAILAAATNGDLLYDLSRWGEDIGLASKATFSRAKQNLEDAGFIDTESVPIEVGRPRLRLHLSEELADADAEEIASVVERID